MLTGRGRWAGVALAALAAGLAACGGGGDASAPPQVRTEATTEPSERGASTGREAESARRRVEPARCPAGVPGCRSATGRVVYVERVDPDGDGDAHFVIADPQGITLPNLTAIDVRKGLRPQPLPGPGEVISAAGPVQTGSYGQRQIHALELNVAR